MMVQDLAPEEAAISDGSAVPAHVSHDFEPYSMVYIRAGLRTSAQFQYTLASEIPVSLVPLHHPFLISDVPSNMFPELVYLRACTFNTVRSYNSRIPEVMREQLPTLLLVWVRRYEQFQVTEAWRTVRHIRARCTV